MFWKNRSCTQTSQNTLYPVTDQGSLLGSDEIHARLPSLYVQEDQHPLTGQRATNFRLLANQ